MISYRWQYHAGLWYQHAWVYGQYAQRSLSKTRAEMLHYWLHWRKGPPLVLDEAMRYYPA